MKFLRRESKSIFGAALMIGSFSFLSRVIGLIRDRVLAGTFGAGETLDIYYAAFKIPDALFTLVVVGAVSTSFIPIFLSHDDHVFGKEKAWRFTNEVLHLIVIVMAILSFLLVVFAEPLSSMIAPGFSELKQMRVASFMRIMFIAQLFLAVSMVYGCVLQSIKRFFIYSSAPIVYNFGIIAGALWFVDRVGSIGLAWGVVFGAFLHLCVQLVGLYGTGYQHRWSEFDLSTDVKEMLRLMGPRTLGLAVNQLMLFLLTVLASTFTAGSLTIFQFAYNIEFFPVGIIGVSFAIAVFPTLCRLTEKQKSAEFIETLMNTTRQLLYFLTPVSLLFLLFRAQIVRLVVGSGVFDWASTIATADMLAFFALTFIPQSLIFILARAYYALHDSLSPFVIALVSALVGILTAYLLRDSFGIIALSIGYSAAVCVNAAILWVCLRQRLGTLRESNILPTVWKLSVSAMASALVMQFLKPLSIMFVSLESFFGVLFQTLIAGGAGLIVYLLFAQWLHVDEQRFFFQALRRRLMHQQVPSEAVSEP